jgi:hypothetical protein
MIMGMVVVPSGPTGGPEWSHRTRRQPPVLALPVLAECFHADCWQRDCAGGIVGFGRHEAQRSADALEGLDDFELGVGEVDVLPAQAEQLAWPQPEEQRQHVDGVEPMAGGGP